MIPLFKVHIPASVDEPLLKVLHSGFIGQGEKVEEFERGLVSWVQNKNVLTLNNGTAGLHLALHLAGVKPGDSVITTPMTCSATNTPIVTLGAKPIWCDVDPRTGNIDASKIEELITIDTVAIVCVHWGGYPCSLEKINQIANDYGIYVIEDAAHAFGAMYKGQRIGSISDFTMFSFQAIKHITTGDGGALTCKSEDHYKRAKLLRWYGIDRETEGREVRCIHDLPEMGWKYHMNDIAATIGLEQLKYAENILFKHRENANYYNLEFEKRNTKRIKPLSYKKDRHSAYWLYTVLVDNRDEFVKFMAKKGVHTSRAHVRNDTKFCVKEFQRDGLDGVTYFDEHQCAIPVGWWVTPEGRKTIMDAIEEFDDVLL